MESNPLPSNKVIWNSIAHSFDTTRKKPWSQVISFLQTQNPAEITVDLGCGNGRHIQACAACSSQVIGIDISTRLLNIAQQHMLHKSISNITFINATLTHLPIRSDSIDIGIYVASLHTLRPKQQRLTSLRELNRILKPRKKALISVWSREQDRFKKVIRENEACSKKTEKGDITVYWRQHKLNVPRFYHLYTKNEFSNEITQAGFEILQIEEASIASNKTSDNYFATVIKN